MVVFINPKTENKKRYTTLIVTENEEQIWERKIIKEIQGKGSKWVKGVNVVIIVNCLMFCKVIQFSMNHKKFLLRNYIFLELKSVNLVSQCFPYIQVTS